MHDEDSNKFNILINKIEQSIADLFPDEFPLFPPDCGGAENYRCIGDHVPASLVTMLCKRFEEARAEITRLKDIIRHAEYYEGRRKEERDGAVKEAERLRAEVERCQSLRWYALCRQIGILVGCKSLENLYQAVEARLK